MVKVVHRYNEIRIMQVNYLLDIWLSREGEESEAVRKKLDEKIDSYAAGKLDHAVDAMLCVWETSNKKKEKPATSVLSVSSSTKKKSKDDTEFKGCDILSALVMSMKEGHLLDRKYWAKRSRKGEIEPIYFFSPAISAELLGFDTCKSSLHCFIEMVGH
jgi:hypothetical protein